MIFNNIAKAIYLHAHFLLNHSQINLKDFENFVRLSGTKDLRSIWSRSINAPENVEFLNTPRRFHRYDSQLKLFFKQRSVSHVFNSILVEKLTLNKLRKLKLLHPIPSVWFVNFELEGVTVNKFLSGVLWKMSLYKKSLLSIFRISKQIAGLKITQEAHVSLKEPNTVYVWSNTIDKSCFEERGSSEYTFINWLRTSSPISSKEVFYLDQDLTINKSHFRFRKNTFKLQNIPIIKQRRLLLILDLIAILLIGLARLLIGKPEFLSMGDQLAIALRVEAAEDYLIPDYVFFSESDGVIKPLWAYSIEKKKAKVVVVFFSASDSPALMDEVTPSFEIYRISSWQEFWVVDATQLELLKLKVGDQRAIFKLTGFPWRYDHKLLLEKTFKPSIAIFDYENLNGFFTFSTLNDVGYLGSGKELKFLKDIIEISQSYNVHILHKTKRDILPKDRSHAYSRVLKSLETYDNYFRVDPRVSPNKVINLVDYVISLPVTSTAHIAKSMGKQSVFYDPVGLMSASDVCLRNLPVLQGQAALQKWFESNFSNQ